MEKIPVLKEFDIKTTSTGCDYIEDENIKDVLSDELWGYFLKWHAGQTGIISDDGKLGVYPWDLERFLNKNPCSEIEIGIHDRGTTKK